MYIDVHMCFALYYVQWKMSVYNKNVTSKKGKVDMPISKAQQDAVNKYKRANYDRVEMLVPKGKKEIIKAHAAAQGESTNGFINRAIDAALCPQEAAGGHTGDFTPLVTSEDIAKVNTHTERTGEGTSEFISRAIDDTIARDNTLLKMGISPARKEK